MATWLITGCSSGLGRALAGAVLMAGLNAVVTARKVAAVQDLVAPYPQIGLAAALDVTQPGQVQDVVRAAEARFGAVDVLVNNAGYGYRAAVEEGDEADVATLFATNVFGTAACIKAVLPGMRARRQGCILNVSSMAGRLGAAGSGYYAATKFAVEGLSDSLRKEVGPLGIRVMVVEPGAFRTEFAGHSLQQSAASIADYAATAGARRKENDRTHGTQPGDPARAARLLIDLVQAGDMPFRLLLGSDAVRIVGREMETQRLEFEAWKARSASTDF